MQHDVVSRVRRRWKLASAGAVLCLAAGAAGTATRPLLPPPSPAIQEIRRHWTDAGINALTFHSVDSIFDTVQVPAGRQQWRLARAEVLPSFSYQFEGKTLAFDDFFDRTFTNALLIIKNDRIVFERYRNFTGPSTRFLSMSMAKSITSILVGAALADGKIRSIDDQVTAYVPALKGTAYDGTTIRNLLLMKSGIAQGDNYQPDRNSDSARMVERSIVLNQARTLDGMARYTRGDAPGTTFRYLTTNTAVLGLVLSAATGMPLDQYMSKRLWRPLGGEANGFWIVDGEGTPRNGMGYNAVMRDYGRIGLMMLHQGRANGRQIVPAAWVRESTVPSGPEPADPTQTRGYQYQWWTLTNSNAYMAIGLQGQFIYVDPDTQTVIVKLSYFPLGAKAPNLESEAFFRAVSAWNGK